MASKPQPDEHGWYRVKMKVDGKTRLYSTKALLGVHEVVDEPASDRAGNPLPPKFSPAETKAAEERAQAEAEKAAAEKKAARAADKKE